MLTLAPFQAEKPAKHNHNHFKKPNGSSRLLENILCSNKTSETKGINFNFTLMIQNHNPAMYIPIPT